MNPLFENYKIQEKRDIKSERAYLISQFVEKINLERKGTKFKDITPRIVAIKTAHLSISDLYFFLKSCEQGDSFGKVFFGSLKIK